MSEFNPSDYRFLVRFIGFTPILILFVFSVWNLVYSIRHSVNVGGGILFMFDCFLFSAILGYVTFKTESNLSRK